MESDTAATFHWGAVTVPLVNMSIRGPKGKITEIKPLPATVISINELIISLKERMFLYKDQGYPSSVVKYCLSKIYLSFFGVL